MPPPDEEDGFMVLPDDDETRPIAVSDKEAIELRIALLKRENEQLKASIKELEKTHSSTASERDRLRESLGKASKMLAENAAVIEELREELQKLMTPPLLYGIVVAYNRDDGTADVLVNGQRHRVSVHPRVTPEQLKRGARVALNGKTMAIQLSTPNVESIGTQAQISAVMSDACALIEDSRGDKRVALISEHLPSDALEPNTPVLLEDGVIVAAIGQGTKRGALGAGSRFLLAEMPDVTFDDIGGLDEELKQLVASLEDPYNFPEAYEKLQRPMTFSAILLGLPGNGKTMIAKAIARRQFDMHREKILQYAPGNFFAVGGTELYSKWLGDTERFMRELFEAAERLYSLTGAVSTIFLDDCESFFLTRSAGLSTNINGSVNTQFSTLVDGVRQMRGVNLLAATNRLDLMDLAVIRRFGRQVRIKPPDTRERAAAVLLKKLRGIEFTGISAEGAVERLVAAIFATTRENELLEINYRNDEKGEDTEIIHLSQMISGKFLADIVEAAKDRALARGKTMPRGQEVWALTGDDLLHALNTELRNKESLPSSKATVIDWLMQRGEKREVGFVKNLRSDRSLEAKRDKKLGSKVV